MPENSMKPFAVVTGASSGIGFELAAQFARHGFDVLAVGEDEEIHRAARSLSDGAEVKALKVDLATFEGVEKLYREIQNMGRPVDAAALNAGVGVAGPFQDTPLDADLNLLRLNVISPVHLSKLLLQDMVRRGKGRLLITSSIAATMPGPFAATYNASKAFLKSFAEAIRNELKETGVSVTALMPGATETNFFDRAGSTEADTKIAAEKKDDAGEVAREGFEALMAGKDHVVAGSFMNKVQATVAHLLPDTTLAEMHRKEAEPGSAKR
jgi:short-subunit dehydrogenase